MNEMLTNLNKAVQKELKEHIRGLVESEKVLFETFDYEMASQIITEELLMDLTEKGEAKIKNRVESYVSDSITTYEELENKVDRVFKYCIFEKKTCKYANRRGSGFSCEAPSDEEMLCR